MKKEELDRLKAKYWEGKTSLEEERRLKELEEEEFFTMLKEPEEKMDWNFDDFMQGVSEEEKPEVKKVVPMTRRIITMTAIAASLMLGFFLIRQMVSSNVDQVKPVIAQTEVNNKILDIENPDADNREGLQVQEETPDVINPTVKTSRNKQTQMVSNKKSNGKSQERLKVEHAIEEEFYVEINGIKIYDEKKALEVTETALQLATSNLRKGMEGVENIKYLKIEI